MNHIDNCPANEANYFYNPDAGCICVEDTCKGCGLPVSDCECYVDGYTDPGLCYCCGAPTEEGRHFCDPCLRGECLDCDFSG